jgi:hypothetical protein
VRSTANAATSTKARIAAVAQRALYSKPQLQSLADTVAGASLCAVRFVPKFFGSLRRCSENCWNIFFLFCCFILFLLLLLLFSPLIVAGKFTFGVVATSLLTGAAWAWTGATAGITLNHAASEFLPSFSHCWCFPLLASTPSYHAPCRRACGGLPLCAWACRPRCYRCRSQLRASSQSSRT